MSLKSRRLMRSTYFWPALQLVSLVVFLGISAYTVREITSERAREEAAEQAEKTQQVSECVTDATQAPTTRRFFNVLEVILNNQVSGLNDRLDEDPGNVDLQSRLSAASAALNDIRSFRNAYITTAPTLRECDQLADELGVPRPENETEREDG